MTTKVYFKAYIPPQCEPLRVGVSRWSRFHVTISPYLYQHVGIQKVLRTQRHPLSAQRHPQSTLRHQLSTQPHPQSMPVKYSSRWVRKGRVCVGHVDFMLFTSCSLTLGTKREPSFHWNMGLRIVHTIHQL